MPTWFRKLVTRDPEKRFVVDLLSRLEGEPWLSRPPFVDFERRQIHLARADVDGNEGVWQFATVARSYADNPTLRSQIVQDFAEFVALRTTEELLNLVLTVRSRAWFEAVRLCTRRGIEESADPPGIVKRLASREVTPNIWMGLAVDKPSMLMHVSESAPYAKEEQARMWARALSNLRDRSDKFEVRVLASNDERPMAAALLFSDHNAAARILLPDLLRATLQEILGDAVERLFAIPSDTGTLFLGDADDTDSVLGAWALRQKLAQVGEPVSARGLVHDGETWQPWRPASALEEIFDTASIVEETTHSYRLQQAPLAKLAPDFVVSEVSMGPPDAESLVSVAQWVEGERTLLPEVDEVVLLPAAGTGAVQVPLKQVLNSAPRTLVRRMDLYPPRFETVRFPSELIPS